jgi:hypothetical protein
MWAASPHTGLQINNTSIHAGLKKINGSVLNNVHGMNKEFGFTTKT